MKFYKAGFTLNRTSVNSQRGDHIISNGKIKADLSNTTDVREIQEPTNVSEGRH